MEHASIVNFLRSMAEEPGLCADDVLLSATAPSFDISILELFGPLLVGGRVVVVPREVATDGARLAHALEESGATVFQATPSSWRMLVDAGWNGDGVLRMLSGGEALSPGLARELLERGGELWNLYGPTETTVWSTVERVGAVADELIPLDDPWREPGCSSSTARGSRFRAESRVSSSSAARGSRAATSGGPSSPRSASSQARGRSTFPAGSTGQEIARRSTPQGDCCSTVVSTIRSRCAVTASSRPRSNSPSSGCPVFNAPLSLLRK